MTLETKVQLLQKAAFGDVDVEKGLAAFHVSMRGPLPAPSLACPFDQSMRAKPVAGALSV